MAARDAHCGLRGNCLGLAAPRCTGLLAQEADVIVLTPVGITWERRSQGRNQPSGVRPSQNRRRADRCGHHERHAGVLLRRLEPNWSITLIERLDAVAAESSGPWNNAGTGHSALCEMNYTPEMPDGSIDITKAVRVNEQFQVTRQFWAYAAENGILTDVRSFLNPVPHVSFVHGSRGVEYLRRRQRRWPATRCSPAPSSSRVPTNSPAGCRSWPLNGPSPSRWRSTGPPTAPTSTSVPSPNNSSAIACKMALPRCSGTRFATSRGNPTAAGRSPCATAGPAKSAS